MSVLFCSFDSLFGQSGEYTDQNLSLARHHCASMSANYGGTEIYSPLQDIFSKEVRQGFVRQVFVLTDGAVSNDDQVITLVKRNAGNTRLFSLGLGNSASRSAIEF